jgi:hypothetical protein
LRRRDHHELRKSGRLAAKARTGCKDAAVTPTKYKSLQATKIEANRIDVIPECSYRCRSPEESGRKECMEAQTTLFEDLPRSGRRAVDGDRTLDSSMLRVSY